MKFNDLNSFKKKLEATSSQLCLIIAKEEVSPFDLVFNGWGQPTSSFDKDNFTSERFTQEVETVPFLAQKVVVYVKDLDQIKASDLNTILLYVKRPNPWVFLLLSAQRLSLTSKLAKAVDEDGLILTLEEKKAAQLLADWLTHRAATSGVALPLPVAEQLVKQIGNQREILRLELEKLICFVGKKAEISSSDIEVVSSVMPHETLWRLGDAILSFNGLLAWKVARELIDGGMVLFPLLATLRTQMRNGFEILSLYQRGGEAAVTGAYPYLKGWILNKKISALRGYGLAKLRTAQVTLFETELKAKNSAVDPSLLLQMLLSKLTTKNAVSR